MERITLRSERLEVQCAPAVGGSIARLDLLTRSGPVPLLRGTDSDYSDVLDSACFPLVPFCNRIREGAFTCDGVTIVLPPNMAGELHPLHGQGWRAAWTVESRTDSYLELAYRHMPDAWPWQYETRQWIGLTEAGLSVRLACRNLSATRMPCALGLHPYYPCTGDTVLDTDVESAWTIDAAVLPVDNVPAVGRYSLRDRRICGQQLDNGFEGWSGLTTISWPEQQLSLAMACADAERTHVYSPRQGGVFVAEPVQNANTALNAAQYQWRALGIELLEQGEERQLTATFTVADFSDGTARSS